MIEYLYRQKRNVQKFFKKLLNRKIINIVNSESYYPERKSKSKIFQYLDLYFWLKKYGEINRFYKVYGLDVNGIFTNRKYIAEKEFQRIRERRNHFYDENSPVTGLRDKLLFYRILSGGDIPTPEVFAYIKDGIIYDIDNNKINKETLIEYKDYFIKEIYGECASFVKHISDYDHFLDILPQLQTGGFIFQKRIFQCEEMNKLYPSSVNTIRIVTRIKDGKPECFTSLLRIGNNKSGYVDNFAAGGQTVGINKNGQLKEFGFYKPGRGTKTESHPDTGFRFSGFSVPMYSEVVELAKQTHLLFPGVYAIGWDIAITNNGLCIIEGNDNWEISLHQICDRPLKNEWLNE